MKTSNTRQRINSEIRKLTGRDAKEYQIQFANEESEGEMLRLLRDIAKAIAAEKKAITSMFV